MMTAESISTITSLLPSSQTICVFFPDKASPDVILSAVTFARGLQSLGKSVTVSSPGLISERLKQFSGVAEVSRELGNKNLDVSFPYNEDQVDKVSYHIDEESKTFHLIVQPKRGTKPLETDLVSFSLSGADADLIFTFGVDKLEDLDQLYIGYEQLFEQSSVVAVHTYDSPFGTVKVNISGSASYAEVVSYLLQQLGVTIDGDSATSLLAAIESATQTFKSLSVTAQTFEISGQLLSFGARRIRIVDEPTRQPAPVQVAQSQQPDSAQATATDSFAKKFTQISPKGQPAQEKQKPKNNRREDMPSNPGMRMV